MFEENQIRCRRLSKGAQMFKMNKPRDRVLEFAGHFQSLEKETKPFLESYLLVLLNRILLDTPFSYSCEEM
jgi:hypothetical protein